MGDKKEDKPDLGKKKVRKEVNLDKRAEQNANKLRRSGGGLFSGNSGNQFEFSTSNPLWRATLQTLEFIPLNTVSYSGGIIVTDWYSSNNSNEEIKFDVRFLSNELKVSSVNVKGFKRTCRENNQCKISGTSKEFDNKIKSKIIETAIQINLDQQKN